MSKRRNPKKEKAQRNQAYARKFRKRKTTTRFSRHRQPSDTSATDAEDMDSGAASSSGGGDDRY